MVTRVSVVLVLSVLAVGVAACGSSKPASNSSAPGSGLTSTASSAQGEGVAAANQYLAQYTKNPTSIGDLTPLGSKPQPGKHVVLLTQALPVGQRVATATKAAAQALGWTLTSVNVGSTPATAVSAFDAALAMHPDAILDNGEPASLFKSDIAKAAAAGIPVITAATGDPATSGVIASLAGKDLEVASGRLAAAQFVVSSGGSGAAAVINIPAYPILTDFTDAFVSAVREWCPSCGTHVLNQQITDVGTSTPSNVVAFLKANPSVKWLVFGIGDLVQGVPNALRVAGEKDVQIVSYAPTQSDLAGVKAGSEFACIGFTTDIEGWRMIDLLARSFEKSDVAKAASVLYPLQILTQSNVSSAEVDDGYYVGVAGYQQQFKQLWHAD